VIHYLRGEPDRAPEIYERARPVIGAARDDAPLLA
jgi:hypothetical protein